MEAFKLKSDVEDLQAKLTVLNEKNVVVDENRFKRLLEKRNAIMSDVNKLEGSRAEIRTQILEIEKTLQSEVYKDAGDKYRLACYTRAATTEEIQSYELMMSNMEKAMIRYQQSKMMRINAIIRDMWRNIYRGNDIEYIEVETSADEENYITGKRRSYSYRVLQCKNGFKSQMRGSCSAGQRVLACLIVRIALAETFSSNCGVLTLDEPTTNLDKENILALVESLNTLIEDRSPNGGLQLVVITHDNHFIDTLGSFNTYYAVGRNSSGISEITKKRKNQVTADMFKNVFRSH